MAKPEDNQSAEDKSATINAAIGAGLIIVYCAVTAAAVHETTHAVFERIKSKPPASILPTP